MCGCGLFFRARLRAKVLSPATFSGDARERKVLSSRRIRCDKLHANIFWLPESLGGIVEI